MPSTSTPPFACTYTDDLPSILAEARASVAISTYQSGKVIVIAHNGDDGIAQLPRSFDVPMGLAVAGDRLAVATRDRVVVLADEPRLASSYPRQPSVYDALYLPRAVYFSGTLDIHDLAWAGDELLAVNTAFSCLARIDAHRSFTPVWQPRFISALAPEDRCHLNGVAVDQGRARYVTALGTGDAPGAWRESRLTGGVVIDVESGEIVVDGLALPHTPRLYDGDLYVLNSAACELLKIDRGSGAREVVASLPGFARGMARAGDYLFIGISQLRERHQAFGDLPIAQRRDIACGLCVVHLPSGSVAAELRYLRSCKEIFDVQMLAGRRRPGLLGLGSELHASALTSADMAAWSLPSP